jgi:hypothetical protein
MGAVTASVKGGDKLAKVLESIGRNARAKVKVGFLAGGATYADGTPIAQVAFWQEFGTPGARFPIPPRPTFRMMIAKHKGEWGGQLGRLLKVDGYDAHHALASMGEVMRDELIDSILHADVAALSAVTLMLRKMRAEDSSLRVTLTTVFEAIRRVQEGESGASGTAARRLIDTGQLSRTPDYEVVD